MNTHNVRLDFGKHKDELLTRVPLSYLKWMINELDVSKVNGENVSWKELARSEFQRRGDTMPKVEISGHAIDRASLRVWDLWMHQEFKKKGLWKDDLSEADQFEEEGFYSWLSRMTLEALDKGSFKNGKYYYRGMKFAIEKGDEFPVLKTVMK